MAPSIARMLLSYKLGDSAVMMMCALAAAVALCIYLYVYRELLQVAQVSRVQISANSGSILKIRLFGANSDSAIENFLRDRCRDSVTRKFFCDSPCF